MKKRLMIVLLAATLVMAAGCKKNSLSPSETQGGEETKITEQQPVDPDEIAKGGNPYYIAEHYDELVASQEAKKAEGAKEQTAEEVVAERESQSTEPSEAPEEKVAGATATPKVTEKPAETQKPAVTPKPAETVKPAETQKPVETKKPAEATEAPKQTSKPAETQKPVETTKPTEKPVETQKPAETPKPADPTPTKAPEPTPTTDPCANGHDYDEGYLWEEPTCTRPGDWCYTCKRCGAHKHVSTSKAPHEMEVESHRDGDCVTPAFTRYQCKNCDHFEDVYDDSCLGQHDWVTFTRKEFDEELLEWVEVTHTRCSRCNTEKD